MGQHGGAVVGKEGFQSWPDSAEPLTPPPVRGAGERDPEQAKPSPGHQCPKAQEDSYHIKFEDQSLQLKINTMGVALAWPGKQDCLHRERKTTSCLWVRARVRVRGREGSYNPSASLLHTSRGYSLRAFGITCLGTEEGEGEERKRRPALSILLKAPQSQKEGSLLWQNL